MRLQSEYHDDDITYWDDGVVTYQLIGEGLIPAPSACEWLIPGTQLEDQ